MKLLILFSFAMLSQQAFGSCEASIVSGSHSAHKQKTALAGAWEEARDSCYPGAAVKLDQQCKPVAGTESPGEQPAYRCEQRVTCTLCGDDLVRKYEAVN